MSFRFRDGVYTVPRGTLEYWAEIYDLPPEALGQFLAELSESLRLKPGKSAGVLRENAEIFLAACIRHGRSDGRIARILEWQKLREGQEAEAAKGEQALQSITQPSARSEWQYERQQMRKICEAGREIRRAIEEEDSLENFLAKSMEG